MKLSYKFLAFTLCLLFTATTLFAQNVGHLNSAKLLSEMPAWKAAQKELQTFAEQLDKSLQSKAEKLQKDYIKVQQDYEAGIVSKKQAGEKLQKLQEREQALGKERAESQQKLLKKEQDVTAPIQERVLKAIDKVAKAKNLIYVFDSSVGGLLFFEDSEDISIIVRSQLGF